MTGYLLSLFKMLKFLHSIVFFAGVLAAQTNYSRLKSNFTIDERIVGGANAHGGNYYAVDKIVNHTDFIAITGAIDISVVRTTVETAYTKLLSPYILF